MIKEIFVEVEGNDTEVDVKVKFSDDPNNEARVIIGGQGVRMSREELKQYPILYALTYGKIDEDIAYFEKRNDVGDAERVEKLKTTIPLVSFSNEELASLILKKIEKARNNEDVEMIIDAIFEEMRMEIKMLKEDRKVIKYKTFQLVPDELQTYY